MKIGAQTVVDAGWWSHTPPHALRCRSSSCNLSDILFSNSHVLKLVFFTAAEDTVAFSGY